VAADSCGELRAVAGVEDITDARGAFVRSFPSAVPTLGDLRGRGRGRRSGAGSTVLTLALS
jgi:hypothetical protein